MKKIYLIIIASFFLNNNLMSQIIIGKFPTSPNAAIDFGESEDLAMIIPRVLVSPDSPKNGTLIYNTITKTVQLRSADAWIDLTNEGSNEGLSYLNSLSTINDGDLLDYNARQEDLFQNDFTQNNSTQQEEEEVNGALEIESEDSALVLPKLNSPQTSIKNPVQGTICYDTETNTIAIYNGIEWTFFGEE